MQKCNAMIDWNDLRYALALAEAGTLRRAARRLGVDPSTVGRRIASLEASLGTTLYLKSARGYAPTAAGVRLLRSLEELARGIAALEQSQGDYDDDEVAGLVRVATTEVSAQHLLERALPALRARHPRLTIELVTGNTATDLGRGEADVAVRFLKPEGVELVGRSLGKLWYGLYGSPAYLARHPPPEAAAGLAGHDALWPSRELSGGPEHAWMRANAGRAQVALQSNSIPALISAAAAGLGLAALPAVLGEAHPGLERALHLTSIVPRTVWLLCHRDARSVGRVRATVEAVADDLRARIGRYAPPEGGAKG